MDTSHLPFLSGGEAAALEAAAADILSASFPEYGRRLAGLSLLQGKRLRARLLLGWAGARPPHPASSLVYAAALELIHAASLIHDDIVDGGDERRGQPSLHRRWDVKSALLAGDFIASQAMGAVIRQGDQAVSLVFSEASAGLIFGEVDQWEHRLDAVSEEKYLAMAGGKTAGLFRAACWTGARLAGLAETDQNRAGAFGQAFGLGFQLVDDILDFTGAGSTGKTPFRDPANGLATLPLIHAFARADGETRERLRRLLAGGPEEMEQTRLLLGELGSLEYTRDKARAFFDQARRALAAVPAAAGPLGRGLEALCQGTLARAQFPTSVPLVKI